MGEERRLLVGIDFGGSISQISCFDDKIFEPVPIGRPCGGDREYEIPEALAVDAGTNEWLWGSDAVRAGEPYIRIRGLSDRIKEEQFEVGGYSFHGREILKRFLLKELSLLKEYYPNDTIKKLVITMDDKDGGMEELVADVCAGLGIGRDRLAILSHRQSYMYYALSQAKELWINNVGMFEYGPDGLKYSQLTIDRKTLPYIVGVKEKDLSDVMPYELAIDGDAQRLKEVFTSAANAVLHKQMVTTIYVTGSGFEGRWASDALKPLCGGRRIFRGQNLFTKGACYAARELAGEGRLDEFIFLDDDMITSDVMIRIYHNAQYGDMILAKAGTRWKEVDASVDFIPDNEEEIQLIARNVLLRESKAHILSLSGFVGRENKMTRFTLRIRFADKNTCIVTLKDNGFGDFCPSSNRIWERYIDM